MSVSGNYSGASLSRGISEQSAAARNDLKGIGGELTSAKTAYRAALESKDETAIAGAQMDYEAAAGKLKAVVDMESAISRIMNSIIEKIGQIGR